VNFDHVAFNCNNISETVKWYFKNLDAKVLYEDESWGLVQIGDLKVAFVLPGKHPEHTAIRVKDRNTLEAHRQKFISKGVHCSEICPHRDGTASFYLTTPNKQVFEWIIYPPEDN
jgi:catechol 2,3-dioxygenase-like lactoylglutathione lyase family enzyme